MHLVATVEYHVYPHQSVTYVQHSSDLSAEVVVGMDGVNCTPSSAARSHDATTIDSRRYSTRDRNVTALVQAI
jgi:hypothetical protein